MAGLLVAAFRLLFQRVEHDFIQAHIDLHLSRRRRELAQRQFAGEHFVKHNTERIDIRAMVHGLRVLHLLRRHVMRCADDLAFLSDWGSSLALRPPATHRMGEGRGEGRASTHNSGNAKVSDLHPALFVEQDVLRLDVAVDDAFIVRELERLANLRDDLQRLARRQFARLLQLSQVKSIDKLHDEEGQSVGLAELMDGDDVRMAQSRQRAGLAIEPLGKTWPARGLRRENLQRHKTVERRLTGFINGPHAPLADESEDFELWKQAGDLGHTRRLEWLCLCGRGRLCPCAVFEQAGRAEAIERARRQRGSALGTFRWFWHAPAPFVVSDTPSSEAKRGKCYSINPSGDLSSITAPSLRELTPARVNQFTSRLRDDQIPPPSDLSCLPLNRLTRNNPCRTKLRFFFVMARRLQSS